jgi:clan AA aspartic protease (TIGR02281 family)
MWKHSRSGAKLILLLFLMVCFSTHADAYRAYYSSKFRRCVDVEARAAIRGGDEKNLQSGVSSDAERVENLVLSRCRQSTYAGFYPNSEDMNYLFSTAESLELTEKQDPSTLLTSTHPPASQEPPIDNAKETVLLTIGTDGRFTVPVTINNEQTLKFVVDSGASDVTIPAEVMSTLLHAGTITEADYLGKQTYTLADGSRFPSQQFVIRVLKIGDKVLEDVIGSVVPTGGTLLLGQSFLSRFKSWSIDNRRRALILE